MAFSASEISKAASLAVLFVITIVGNILVSVVLLKFRRQLLKNRPTYQFILNIVLSDLVVGLATMPFEFVNEFLSEWIFGRTACKIIEFIEIAVSGTAVFTHACIAFDRYRGLARPYLPKMQARVVRKLLILSWIVPAFASSPYLYMFNLLDNGSKTICTPNAIPIKWLDKLYEAIEFVIVLLGPFLILCWCYFRVIYIMWGRSHSVNTADSEVIHSAVLKSKKRVTRTSGLVATVFTVCWTPTFILSFVRIVSGTDRIHRGHLLHEISMFGTFINEAVNPIIYCAFDRNIKERFGLRVICTYAGYNEGLSKDIEETNNVNIATASGYTQMSFRTLDQTISTNGPAAHGGKTGSR